MFIHRKLSAKTNNFAFVFILSGNISELIPNMNKITPELEN